MSEGRVEELKEKIEKWQEELDTIWKDKDTDAAEVERRNLRNLINQAKREIDEIENGPKEEEKIDLEKEFEEIKKSKDNKESEKNRLKLHIEKLREEQENYSTRKNTSYREIYDEYEKQIKESEKKLEELEKEESGEEKDKKLKTCTQLRMKYEKDIKEKEKEIREVERKIEDIEFGTEEAQEEIEIINKDGTKEKVKAPKILKLYEELKKLKGELKDLEGRRQECQKLIDEIYGRDKEKEKRELEPEEIAYFHGQGDRVENTRDDRRANDEYFGFEKQGKGERKGPNSPNSKNPESGNPGPKKTEPKDPGAKNPGIKNPESKKPEQGENLALVKSGLQIFREQFNQMPEIKNRHTAAERFKIVAPLLTTAGICSCAIPVVGPFIGIPVAATSAILRPIIYRATGQKKLEKQIEDQFKGMDEEEFDRMVEFLTEEKIQDLKPNAVILNALNKVMQERTKKKESELKDEMVKLKKQREELLLIDMSSLTKQEQEELNSRFGEINKRIIEIREDKVPKLERELKDIKRGRDRVSATYKGNLKTRFNILARRNSTTERYAPAINAYADAEKARDDAMILGNQREGSEQDKKMENVGKEYTYTNKFGIQISQFNMRDGLVRKISDLKDQTIRRICSLTTLGVGSAIVWKNHVQINKAMENNETSFNRIINEHNGQVRGAQETVSGIDQGTVQSVADGHVTDAAAQAEHTIVNNLGRTSAQGYREADALAQNDIAEVASGSKITGNKVSEMMQKLAEVVRSRAEIAGRYAESAQNANLSPNAVDHGAQFAYTSNAGTQNEATAHLFDKMSDLIKKVENMAIIDAKFEKVKSSLLGPAIMACGTILDRARSRIENKKEENYNKTMNTPDKTEEQDITTDNDAR